MSGTSIIAKISMSLNRFVHEGMNSNVKVHLKTPSGSVNIMT